MRGTTELPGRCLKKIDDLEYLQEIIALERIRRAGIRLESDNDPDRLSKAITRCVIRLLVHHEVKVALSGSELALQLDGIFGIKVTCGTMRSAKLSKRLTGHQFLPHTPTIEEVFSELGNRLPACAVNELRSRLLEFEPNPELDSPPTEHTKLGALS
jgi:hypothetical protein